MQYILPTEKFEELINQDNWNSLLTLGIDESYLLTVIISHICLNGQVELDGSVHIPDHINLEYELNYGNLQYYRDDIRERFLYSKTKLPVKIIVSSLAHYIVVLYMSLGETLMSMIKSLQLSRKYELPGIRLKILGKVYQGLMVDISYQKNPMVRGYQYA